MRQVSHIIVIAVACLVAAVTFGSSGAETAGATTLVVNSLADPGAGACDAAECTLREAILAAPSGSTIRFDPSLAGGTIVLGSTLVVDKNLGIDGSGLTPHVIVSGNNAVGVWHIDRATVVLTELDIVAGEASERSGGGILNDGGVLTVAHSTLFGNNTDYSGGGIYNDGGALTVTNSTLAYNMANTVGGGIDSYGGTLTVTNSTFFRNGAPLGGGIALSWNSTLAATNSTFSGNRADAGGGILVRYAINSLTLINTIIANSVGGNDCQNNGGTIVADLHNLIEDNKGCGAPVSTDDPGLGVLQDNGGSTKTMAIGPSSPAYNAGDNAHCPATDQRGVARPQSGTCDMGAFESTEAWGFMIYLPLVSK